MSQERHGHIQAERWRDIFDEVCIESNADISENPTLTAQECILILGLSDVASLFDGSSQTDTTVKILDLYCGQGRRSVKLAGAYPAIEFHGHDTSGFLIEVAEKQAKEKGCENITFTAGDACAIPVNCNSFDLVLIMGNSFGYHPTESGNADILQEVHRVLKPGGTLVIDQTDADVFKATFSPGKWSQLDATTSTFMPVSHRSGQSHIACRARELSLDKKWVACRHLTAVLEHDIKCEAFYHLRLYGLNEMNILLEDCGLTMNQQEPKKFASLTTEQNTDIGDTTTSRNLVVAKKGNVMKSDSCVHPSLVVDEIPIKGKGVRSIATISAGTLLIIGEPYALVPWVPARNGIVCSRLDCSRRVYTQHATCPNKCAHDVVWCNDECRSVDTSQHEFECHWLKENSANLRREHGERDFWSLWLLVRTLRRRHREVEISHNSSDQEVKRATGAEFACDWFNIWAMRSNESLVASEKLQHWTSLISKYLMPNRLPHTLHPTDMLSLICKEQMNSFGLYFSTNGVPSGVKRGQGYAAAFYPGVSVLNHSCMPNVTRKPDENSRMVLRASRDIAAGEECCVSYLDLAAYVLLDDRRRLLREEFAFTCMCERCLEEEKSYIAATSDV